MAEFDGNLNHSVENLRQFRDKTKMSRQRLSDLLSERGISLHSNSIKRIEDGIQPLKLDEAVALTEIFSVNLNDFVYQPVGGIEAEVGAARIAHESAINELRQAVDKAIDTYVELGQLLDSPEVPPAPQSATVHRAEFSFNLSKTFLIAVLEELKESYFGEDRLDWSNFGSGEKLIPVRKTNESSDGAR